MARKTAAASLACPECASAAITPIVYGFPSLLTLREAEEGRIALGGCVVGPVNPTHHCEACGHRWALKRPQRRRP